MLLQKLSGPHTAELLHTHTDMYLFIYTHISHTEDRLQQTRIAENQV